MLRRLEVGLIDEGVTVARAAPRGGPAEPAAGLAANLTYSTGGVRWLSISPSRQLLDALKTVTPFKSSDAKGPLDIVHAWGTGAWPIAIELVQHTGAAVADCVGISQNRAADRDVVTVQNIDTVRAEVCDCVPCYHGARARVQ